MSHQISTLEIGTPYTLFKGRDMSNQCGCILECHEQGELFFNIYIDDMTNKEKQSLRFDKIETRVIQESNYIYALLKFGNNLLFEIEFDPNLYKDNRVNNIKGNMVYIISIESNNNIIQTLRYVNIPQKLFSTWLSNWNDVLKINDYSEKYKKWIDDLRNRYSPLKLWEYGKFSGYIGE